MLAFSNFLIQNYHYEDICVSLGYICRQLRTINPLRPVMIYFSKFLHLMYRSAANGSREVLNHNSQHKANVQLTLGANNVILSN